VDKRAAGQYLNSLFSDNKGYVAVAYKPKDSKGWHEEQFSWPDGRTALLSWAQAHRNDNVFICPSLRRDPQTRKKGDMQPTKWLWADVDWQGVPADKVAEVQRRITELGTLTVSSGSNNNAHVYVELDHPVPHAEFIKLNTGLRDYLYGDNKQADNSLLRLPGTTNWKTEAGQPVAIRKGNDKTQGVASLMRKRAFRDAKVIVDTEATEWDFVEVQGLPRRIQSKVNMPVEEARGIYGKRHAAVWAVTKDLIKYNLDPDEIHSIMHNFPPALDKMAEENGYDVHRDVDKCLAAHRVVKEAHPDLTDDQVDEVLQELTDDEQKELVRDELIARANRIAFEDQARQLARQMEAERTWVAPPDDVSWSLTDVLTDPPPPAQYLIGIPDGGNKGLCGVKHNVVITAQYKTGKTKFVIATIAKALADGTDFMGQVPVHTPPGGVVVGHWNCEMDAAEIASEYVIPAGFANPHNMVGANLRGHRVNLLTPQGKRWAVQWLRDRKVKVWTIDSLARLARMANVSEKDNDEMFDLLMALDEVKIEAEVDVIFLITHTGRVVQEEGKERARGATAIDDWADARWVMTNEGGVRFLAVDGRGVGMNAAPLIYDEETGHSEKGFGGREEVKADGAIETIARIVKDQPGITQKALQDALRGKMSARVVMHTIEEAVEAGKVEIREDHGGRGRPAKRHYLASYEPPTGDRMMKATPRDLDMRDVRTRGGRLKY
jgi:hypothetical protein